MIKSYFFDRIRNSDKILVFFFCSFMIWANYSSMSENTGLFDVSGGPYTDYYNNKIIKILNIGAFVIDILICLFFMLSIFFVNKNNIGIKNKSNKIFIFLFSIGILLIWSELYYGSTFYYGEIRGMQMLPFFVNNFGILGSTLFLRQIFKEIPDNIIKIFPFKKYPFMVSVLINLFLALALNRVWSFHLGFI